MSTHLENAVNRSATKLAVSFSCISNQEVISLHDRQLIHLGYTNQEGIPAEAHIKSPHLAASKQEKNLQLCAINPVTAACWFMEQVLHICKNPRQAETNKAKNISLGTPGNVFLARLTAQITRLSSASKNHPSVGLVKDNNTNETVALELMNNCFIHDNSITCFYIYVNVMINMIKKNRGRVPPHPPAGCCAI